MMFWDKATTNCPALFFPPQLPRPGVYQVPYEPKGQCREQKVTKKQTRTLPECVVRFSNAIPSGAATGAERMGRTRENNAKRIQVSRCIVKLGMFVREKQGERSKGVCLCGRERELKRGMRRDATVRRRDRGQKAGSLLYGERVLT